ncbi:MAG: tol-pal system protein YbgF [Devosia sp.]|nr:tol-pal system protein YbgF [Devosia sp.]
MVTDPRPRGPVFRSVLARATLVALLGVTLPASADPYSLPGLKPPAEIGEGRILLAQNQQSAAQLLIRIQELEAQIRTLTGQVEGLQFQLTQMQTMLEKQMADTEFRFQQLEGGALGKPQAAAPTDGAMPSDALPQTPTPDIRLEPTPDAVPGGDQPMDLNIGESSDPLLQGGTDQLGTLSLEDELSLGPSQPLDLSLNGGEISNGDAKAQYEAGYEAMTRGDYAFAEEQFAQFVALYPDDVQVPDAINWLGEALIQRGAYTEAAQVLADGYTRHKDSKRAPDIMLKLGVALVGAEQVDVACRTFYTLRQRYPDLAPAFQQRLAEEVQKAKCPVT